MRTREFPAPRRGAPDSTMGIQTELAEGQVVVCPFFPEPVRVDPEGELPVQNRARLPWHEVRKVDSLPVDRLGGTAAP